ncbi:MAG: DUF4126 domain-containing protein [Chthoniobacterales bacterium]
MDQLKLLGVALGLACLAGVNLYLTVFATGLAIHLHWIVLGPQYESLALLGNPVFIWVSGTLYVIEFFADKIPWVDSAWDTVHTIIRPIGGALLAIRVLGETTPAFDLAVALAAGGASLVTHSAKASTRLVANTSPEPFSNVGLSLVEDAAVVGGLALIHFNPLYALGVFVLLLSIILYFAPKIFRAVRVKLWLIWKKLNGPAGGEAASDLPTTIPSRYASAFNRENLLNETVAWAAPCICKKAPGVAANACGVLVATNEDPNKLSFIVRKSWSAKARALNLEGCVARREPKFLSENLLIMPENGRGTNALFFFERGRRERVQQIVDFINNRAAATIVTASPAEPTEPAPAV